MRDQPKSTAPPWRPPFDESDGWRRTTLYRVTNPRDRAALIRLSRMLDGLILEVGRCWCEMGESSTLAEARAAAGDLRYLEAFLLRMGEEDYDPDEEPAEFRLARLAKRLAPRVGKIAAAIEEALA